MHRHARNLALVFSLPLCFALGATTPAQAQKYGGILHWSLRGQLVDLSILETAISGTATVVAPMTNNVVTFDSLDPRERPESIVADLAERWDWSADGTELRFTLRKDVAWHDGKPFTSADVKHTFDVVRGVKRGGLKLNPRRNWYVNVAEIVTAGDHAVAFRLKRPQPSLLSMLAAGFSPVVPAHMPAAQLRTKALGTGPFKLKRYEPNQKIEIERNPAYFKRGRPFLDGVTYVLFSNQSAEQAALIARQVDALPPLATPGPMYEALKAANVGVAFAPRTSNATINLIVNTKRGPFTNPRLRLAVSLAMDRDALIRSVFQNGAQPGTAFIPRPQGVWGMTAEERAGLPGFGDPATNKAEARRILAELGYTTANPFRVKLSSRSIVSSQLSAAWAAAELKQVGIEAELHLVERANWYGMVARRDFVFAINETAVAIDDADAVLYETYACGSERNYSDYCNIEVTAKMDAQSQLMDVAKRRALVTEIDRQLQTEVARPYLAYRNDYYAHYPYVKNWVPHTSISNGWRLEEVWL
ncbi:MAG: ABC transporter substrate-binding protein, partial [Candidatus Lambdaproteobacteria bacterium]|nr:ABC transporter substrate-binding protein [Candidatus Lambdaproteobacteria bacterium]